MRKLLFFDVDGTIADRVGKKNVVPQSAKDAIKNLQKNGHLCFINTGRALSEIDVYLKELNMDGFICGCGTYILYKNEILFSQTIPFDIGNELIKDLEKYDIEWLLEGEKTLYYRNKPYTTHIGDFKNEQKKLYPDAYKELDPAMASNLVFDEFCIGVHKNSDFKSFSEKYSKIFTIIDRGNSFYEIVPSNCSKATGIEFLMEYFNVEKKDTIAIGDSNNDLPMLEFAGTSIAMKHSPKTVLDKSDYITDDVFGDGIYNAMKHFKLI